MNVKIGDMFCFTRHTIRGVVNTSYCIIVRKYEYNAKPFFDLYWIDDYGSLMYSSKQYKPDHFEGESWRKVS